MTLYVHFNDFSFCLEFDMFSVFRQLILSVVLIVPLHSHAGECGIGRVLAVMEGGWNENNFFVKLDSYAASQHQGTYVVGGGEWIRFQSNQLEAARYSGIKALAISALTSGRPIRVYSHVNSCSSATEMALHAS